MPLAFARHMSPETPYLMAAVLAGRRRPRQRPGAKDWLRIAHRLAAGLPPRAAALPEGADEALVARLLEREEFRALVEGSRDDLAASPEAHRKRLIGLARQALERALICDDAPVAVFVLEEEAHDRDPAVTLAEGVLKAKARSLRPPPEQPPKPRPSRYRWDPLRSMMHRGTARLRHDIQAEDAIRHAAVQAASEPPRTTAEAAKRALALKTATSAPSPPEPDTPPRREALAARLRSGTAIGALDPADACPKGLLRAWAQGP